jgi:AraC family transcriptional regulator of adaptative response/methylated-DNA-[protein]-cysteine methyltransferase
LVGSGLEYRPEEAETSRFDPMSTPEQPAHTEPIGPVLEQMLGPARPGATVAVRVLESPVGPFVAAANDDGLTLLEFANNDRLARQVGTLERLFGPTYAGNHPVLDQTASEMTEYFEGSRHRFTMPLVIRGTPFQESVWHLLVTIPYGETRAYADLADQLAIKNGQRAVGLANGSNRISIIVPCHRVIERSGGLRGYGGGLWRKKFLLDLERRYAPGGALAGTPLGSLA